MSDQHLTFRDFFKKKSWKIVLPFLLFFTLSNYSAFVFGFTLSLPRSLLTFYLAADFLVLLLPFFMYFTVVYAVTTFIAMKLQLLLQLPRLLRNRGSTGFPKISQSRLRAWLFNSLVQMERWSKRHRNIAIFVLSFCLASVVFLGFGIGICFIAVSMISSASTAIATVFLNFRARSFFDNLRKFSSDRLPLAFFSWASVTSIILSFFLGIAIYERSLSNKVILVIDDRTICGSILLKTNDGVVASVPRTILDKNHPKDNILYIPHSSIKIILNAKTEVSECKA